mmetsp:Transcript_19313/g.49613  ORF Transcript_19313/g.49613 Transcript_19313/m.49613 type:complete len:216 (+) Transcript_19313:145-792(+)
MADVARGARDAVCGPGGARLDRPPHAASLPQPGALYGFRRLRGARGPVAPAGIRAEHLRWPDRARRRGAGDRAVGPTGRRLRLHPSRRYRLRCSRALHRADVPLAGELPRHGRRPRRAAGAAGAGHAEPADVQPRAAGRGGAGEHAPPANRRPVPAAGLGVAAGARSAPGRRSKRRRGGDAARLHRGARADGLQHSRLFLSRERRRRRRRCFRTN